MKKTKMRSLRINGILNLVRNGAQIVVPLFIYKHVSQILSVENLGRYNFSATVVSYFSFISALGITAYSIRTGVKYRNDRDRFDEFVSDIFSINIVSTITAYLLMAVICLLLKWDKYTFLIAILGLQIFFTTIGVDWINSIMEDYLYITIRTIIFQLVSLGLVLLLVKDNNDTYNYAFITVSSLAGANVLNFFHVRKYCRIRVSFNRRIWNHIIPILIIFAQNISVLIFVNSDVLMLGILASDYNVGLYSVAANVYKGMKGILSALIVVSIPRLSYYIGNNDLNAFNSTIKKVAMTLISLALPMVIGVIALSENIIILLSTNDYLKAADSLRLLSVSTIFSTLSYVYGQCILIPLRKEKVLLFATSISAITNILLNIYIIPVLMQTGAAISTIISEAVVFLICWFYIHKEIQICDNLLDLCKPIIGCIPILLITYLVKSLLSDNSMVVIVSIVLSMVVYYFIEIAIGNRVVINLTKNISLLTKK